MPSIRRLISAIACAAFAAAVVAPAALASTTQQSIIEDDVALHENTDVTLQTMRNLGATTVKLAVYWDSIAPDPNSKTAPKGFDASDPADYPALNWAFYDGVVRQAAADGLKVELMLTSPAPIWATGTGAPKSNYQDVWKPSAADYGAWVEAMGKRYDGSYTPAGQSSPLPRVSMWSIWNEPNYGPNLAPQAIDHNTVYEGADMYRELVDHAWSALKATGHTPSRDTILIGETAPRGVVGKDFPGDFSGTMPVNFIQTLYCVNGSDRELTGKAATENDCPGSARKVRSENPALFDASGWADHPYAQGVPPNIPTYQCGINRFCFNTKTKRSTPGYADFAELGRLETLLGKVAGRSYPIWNTEFGYWTNPPDNQPDERSQAVSPTTAALYMNWAEYLSYESPRIASYDQYLLVDPVDDAFSTGLELNNGTKLATYAAYATPLFMPTTSVGKASSLTVWGAVRAASVLSAQSLRPQAEIQFQAGSKGAYRTLRTVTITNPRGYFDVKQAFTQSGTVRIAWSDAGSTLYSRTQTIKVG